MTIRQWFLLIFLSLLWGGSFLFNELALTGLPVLSVVWFRVAGGALVLGLWLRGRGQAFPRGAQVWRALLVMGLLNNALPFTLFVLAQSRIEGALAAIVNATTPLWTLLLAHAFTRDERLTPGKLLGIALGFAGVAVMTGGQAGGTVLAILACLGAAFSYGLAGVWGRRFKGLDPLQTAFGMLASSTVLLLPLWLVLDRPWQMAFPGWPALGAMAGLVFLSTALAYRIYFRLLASAGATNLSLVTFLIPVSAIALGTGFLGEVLLPRHLAGLALILAGLVATQRPRRRTAQD